jgi:hypothetical protein
LFYPIFLSNSVIIPFAVHPFDICKNYPTQWFWIKIASVAVNIIADIIISNSIYSFLIYKVSNRKKKKTKNKKQETMIIKSDLNLFIGLDENDNKVFIPEKGMYQNILVTGTIGSGKTSSCMYPFTEQLIKYKAGSPSDKIGMLLLDVKGNYYRKVLEYAKKHGRTDDVIVIEIGGKYKYNPLHKPNLKPTVIANRLKTVLTLFSPNNSESYWLDKAEATICECIKICRLYNKGYVNFTEIHNLINNSTYYMEKIEFLREEFRKGKLDNTDVYNLMTSLNFFEKEFNSLDARTASILKSEISRITSTFISDYDVLNTFCPEEKDLNFHGFEELISKGKIVVLNMNISEYNNLSKIIAAYLKLDFQAEVMFNLSSGKYSRTTAFVSDEFHEYITNTDADFFAQSREAKCINIVATQSYTSFLKTLKEESAVNVIIQNLINKLWFRTDDIFTIEKIQKQIGKEEKIKTSNSLSENAKETNYNYLLNNLSSMNSSLSESINTYTQSDFVYDTNFFTQELETFFCLSFLSDGLKILPPQKLSLIPYFKSNEKVDIDTKKSKYKII